MSDGQCLRNEGMLMLFGQKARKWQTEDFGSPLTCNEQTGHPFILKRVLLVLHGRIRKVLLLFQCRREVLEVQHGFVTLESCFLYTASSDSVKLKIGSLSLQCVVLCLWLNQKFMCYIIHTCQAEEDNKNVHKHYVVILILFLVHIARNQKC